MNLGTAQVLRADARAMPLADNSVDIVVTSPPYFALRSYQDGGVHYSGQIGSEPTPAEFVASLLEVTRECVRVLKPSGSLWVNLGDKYATRSAGLAKSEGQIGSRAGARDVNPRRPPAFPVARDAHRPGVLRDKSLMGIPWRYAIACIDDLGLILRSEVVWSKPNGLPESVTDRVRRSHEQWFHFTLEPRYFSAVDEIREKYDTADRKGPRRSYPAGSASSMSADGDHQAMTGPFAGLPLNPLGKLPGSVWTVPTEPLRVPDHLGVDHFAAFPTEWPRRIINGWSPTGICTACGEGRRPVTCKKPMEWRAGPKAGGYETDGTTRKVVSGTMLAASETTITGYACACPEPSAPTRSAVVLDPCGGTGTTALVAKALGRHGISVDMSADYCRLAQWRTNDPRQLERVQNMQQYGTRTPTKTQIRAAAARDEFEGEPA